MPSTAVKYQAVFRRRAIPVSSVAAARLNHHVAVLLEDDVGVVVEVENGQTGQLRGGAAGLRNGRRFDEMRHLLNDRVVCGVVGVQR